MDKAPESTRNDGGDRGPDEAPEGKGDDCKKKSLRQAPTNKEGQRN